METKTLREWAGLPEFPERFTDLFDCLAVESDRGCVLIAAAALDGALESLLRAFFRDESDITRAEEDFLLTREPQPPLRSTAIKARLAHAIGLLPRDMYETIRELNSLRSKHAAHVTPTFSITQSRVDKIASKLVLGSRRKEVLSEVVKQTAAVRERLNVPEQRFRLALIAGYLILDIADLEVIASGEISRLGDSS